MLTYVDGSSATIRGPSHRIKLFVIVLPHLFVGQSSVGRTNLGWWTRHPVTRPGASKEPRAQGGPHCRRNKDMWVEVLWGYFW